MAEKQTNILTDSNKYDIKEFKDCIGSGTTVEVEQFIIVDDDPRVCKSDDLWYKNEVDLTIQEFEPDSIEFGRDEDDGDSTIQQTTAGKITITRSLTIKAKHGSNFLDRISLIMINDSESNSEGDLLQAYADGGIHMATNYIYNSGTQQEFTIQVLDLNLKLTTMSNPLSGVFKSDTELSFEANIERMPVYRMQGVIPFGYALPDDITAPTIDITSEALTDLDLTLGVSMVDSEGVMDPDNPTPIGVEVFNANNERIGVATVPISATEIIVPLENSGEPILSVTYAISYSISNAQQITWFLGEATQNEVLNN